MLKLSMTVFLSVLLCAMLVVSISAAQDQPVPATADTAGVWIDLLELVEDQTEWTLGLGNEFRGAMGELTVVPAPVGASAAVAVNERSMKLAADFTGGGAYIEAARKLDWLDLQRVEAVRLTLRSANACEFNLRLIDGTGQVHQLKAVPFTADGAWRQLTLDLPKITSGEHWGGANDGQWHGSPKLITLMLTHRADPGKQPEMLIGGVELLGVVPVRVEPSSFQESFEQAQAKALPEGWTKQGAVAVTATQAFEGDRSLQLSRTLQSIDQPTQAVGPAFAASPGQWEVAAATRGSLYSPDNSFHGSVRLECLDASNAVIAGFDIAAQYDKPAWTAHRKRVDLPKGTHAARFRMDLHKTHGTFDIDGLSAAYLSPSSYESQRIIRALIRSQRLGNLLYPDDKPELDLTIEARRPLPAAQREVQYTLRDYWGNTQGPARTATLKPAGRGKQKEFLYETRLDLAGLPMEVGRYYETHIAIHSEGDAPFRDDRSFAVLPEAPAKQYEWHRIPFTSRNWDNRMTDYFHLSDRLGLRTAGIWSDWSPKPPYKPAAPGIDTARKLDMGMVLRSVIFKIEHHRDNWKEYDEQALREGVISMIKAYGEGGNILITLGNEPPLLQERAEEAVKAYKIVYEAIKEVAPQTTVISTAVGASEIYFKAGFHHYCDVLDFHTYEEPDGIRKTLENYERLFEKYGGRKPIWSTEVGLNSQGMSRIAVANSLIRKFAIFFASGGQNISWFTIMYPDPEGKASGNASDAHNVFDARYRIYSPRLDAIAYYNMVNGIAIKKCVGERTYEDGTAACLFADDEGRRLQVLWTDEAEHEVMVPLPGVGRVKHIAIDGRITMLDAAGQGLTLRVGRHPVLLMYEGGEPVLVSKLSPPAMTLNEVAEHMTKGNSSVFAVSVANTGDEVELLAPPQWPVKASAEQRAAAFEVAVPEDAAGWAAPLSVLLKDEHGRARGLLQWTTPIKSRVDSRLQPLPMQGSQAGVQLTITNNAPVEQEVRWRIELLGQAPMRAGKLNLGGLEPSQAYFTEAAEGTVTIGGHQNTQITLPLAGIDPLATYRARVMIVDEEGQSDVSERWIAGFAGAPRVRGAIQLDGVVDEADWARAPLALMTEQRQFQVLKAVAGDDWAGPDDLSAKVRYLWDDQCLYIAVEVTDDVHVSAVPGKEVWRQDGLQMLIDPSRGAPQPVGKYDYAMGNMPAGPMAQCYLTADPKVTTGTASEIKVAMAGNDTSAGGRTYELAIPWSRLSPFVPNVGANLGLALALNEDDGPGRYSYLGWFGDLQTKQVDAVGDIILGE